MEHHTEGIARRLNIKFNEPDLINQALTHSSFANENMGTAIHNERLEFLGDAVLELIMSEHLYKSCPQLPEGELTKLRANMVCEASLARVARDLNLGEYLFLGRGEKAAGGQDRPSILADTLEALIGALYLDQGLTITRNIIIHHFEPMIIEIKEGHLVKDYKTMVQELTQCKHNTTPKYMIVDEFGPDHDKIFVAQIFLKEKVPLGEGRGKSKKIAEQAAARMAWEKLRN